VVVEARLKMNYARMKLKDGHRKTPPLVVRLNRMFRVAQRSEAESGAKRFGSVARCACEWGLDCENRPL
jgi:hypothetical protein